MVRRPLGEMIEVLASRADAVHGVYYLLLRLWTALAGDSIEATRAFSAVGLGVAAGATVVLVGRYLNPEVAVASGVAVGLLPGLTWTAIEGRSYAWAVALAVLATIAFDTACTRGERRAWFVYGAACLFACWWHLYLVVLLLAHGVAVALDPPRRQRAGRAWLLTTGAVALAVLPLAGLVWSQREQVAWLDSRDVGWDAMGTRILSGNYPSAPVDTRVALVIGVLLLLALGVEHLWRSGERWSTLLLTTWAGLPITIALTSALGGLGIAHPRYVTFAVPPVVALAVAGCAVIPRRGLVAVGAAALLAAVPLVVAQRAADARPHDLRAIAAATRESRADAVAFTTPLARSAAFAYPSAFETTRDLSRLPWGTPDPFFDETRKVEELDPRQIIGRRVVLVATAEVPHAAVFDELGCQPQTLYRDRSYRVRLYRCPD